MHLRGAGMADSISLRTWNELTDKWALAIGRFIFAFAECAFYTYKIIEIGTDDEIAKSLTLDLGDRLKLAENVLGRPNVPRRLASRFRRAFTEMRALAKERNLAAHDSSMGHVDIYPGGKVRVVREIRSVRDPSRSLNMRDLRALQKRSVVLSSTLSALLKELPARAP